MSWMAKLYDTYDGIPKESNKAPWPEAHAKKNAHIEVVIDPKGNFIRARVLEGNEASTIIPVTEKSAARTGNIEPHPLCEELSYCAFDLEEGVKKKEQRNEAYRRLITQWVESDHAHPKVIAIYNYIEKAELFSDLSRFFEFPIVFKASSTQKIEARKCFVRWKVEQLGQVGTGTWEDSSLIEAWINFENTLEPKQGFCYVTGERTRLAKYHPKFLRNAADGARFITQNDWDGYTFLGRFTDGKKQVSAQFKPSQVSEVSFEVTQKAHNALRWLIANQGKRNGDQVIVAWAVSGKPIPPPLTPTLDLDNFDAAEDDTNDALSTKTDISRDMGQNFAKALGRYMDGYFDGRIAELSDSESIVIMGLDSATPGRMAITYYRDFMAKEYIATVKNWHLHLAWPQRVSKEEREGKKHKKTVHWFVGAPSPWNILQATYGDVVKSNEALKKNLYERITPCITENRPIPIDLVRLAVKRVSNRSARRVPEQYSSMSSENAAWESELGVACALYRGYHHPHRQPDLNQRRDYIMSLDLNNHSRDYLYGRLLAVAEKIEELALQVAGVNRTTTAARLMQRFSDRPYSTWRTIYGQLQPYIQQLQVSRRGFIENRKKDLDEITERFEGSDFTNDKALSGEYLLGFHCQRMALRKKQDDIANTNPTDDDDK